MRFGQTAPSRRLRRMSPQMQHVNSANLRNVNYVSLRRRPRSTRLSARRGGPEEHCELVNLRKHASDCFLCHLHGGWTDERVRRQGEQSLCETSSIGKRALRRNIGRNARDPVQARAIHSRGTEPSSLKHSNDSLANPPIVSQQSK